MNTKQNYGGRGNYSTPNLIIHFWRRQSKQAGKAQIYCRISVNGERIDIGSTGITIYHENWEGNKVSKRDPEATFKNEQIEQIRHQLLAVFNDLFRRKEKISANKIKRVYHNEYTTYSFLAAFSLYIDDSIKDPTRNLAPGTISIYKNIRLKLQEFLEYANASELPVEEFDLEWLRRYRVWMKKAPLESGQIGYSESYVVKHAQVIKFMLSWSVLHKIADVNPLKGHRIKGAKYGDPVFLTDEEFARVKEHCFSNKILQQTADIFIILCRTGFHYGDLEDIVTQYRKAVRKGVDGNPWLIKDRIKTEVPIRVPLFAEVKAIIDKYGGWEKLPLRPIQKFNGYLKLIAATLNLPENLSSKAGRKTFTDWCFNELMLSTTAVMVMLGRKSDSGLAVYGKPDERRVVAELNQGKSVARLNQKTGHQVISLNL